MFGRWGFGVCSSLPRVGLGIYLAFGVLVGWCNIGFLRGFGFTGCFRGMAG